MQRKASIILGLSLTSVAAVLTVFLFLPAQERPMPYELSPQEMREPLRVIDISIPNATQAAAEAKLREFGRNTAFAIYISPTDTNSRTATIGAYRSDLSIKGILSAGGERLLLMAYRTFDRVPKEAIDQGVEGLRRAFVTLPGARFTQKILVRGDDMRLDPRNPIKAARAAALELDDRHYEMVKSRLLRFAEENGKAAIWGQLSPDPRNFALDLYDEGITIFSASFLSERRFRIAFYRTGDRSASEDAISALFASLRFALEEIDGVTFIDRSGRLR